MAPEQVADGVFTAVSQQVRTLERYLGTRLFKRLPRGLLLTELGSTYLPVLTAGFDRLRDDRPNNRGGSDCRAAG